MLQRKSILVGLIWARNQVILFSHSPYLPQLWKQLVKKKSPLFPVHILEVTRQPQLSFGSLKTDHINFRGNNFLCLNEHLTEWCQSGGLSKLNNNNYYYKISIYLHVGILIAYSWTYVSHFTRIGLRREKGTGGLEKKRENFGSCWCHRDSTPLSASQLPALTRCLSVSGSMAGSMITSSPWHTYAANYLRQMEALETTVAWTSMLPLCGTTPEGGDSNMAFMFKWGLGPPWACNRFSYFRN